MVHLMKSGKTAPESESRCRKMAPVKMEAEDTLEDEHGPHNKRSKLSSSLPQENLGACAFPQPPSQYNPLDEPSPLGLRLRKSPSLLDLIQMRLSQGNVTKAASQAKKEHKGAASSATEKLKASNFPGSLLRIGTWEYKSRYEGDLVAKCYFAKHKLVWEVLDGGLKNKIEIQWSDIVALKANYPDDGPGTLDVVLGRQPLFFRETNPQPRKHTLWQATSDFTGGQASIHRKHFLQCPQGLLGKHFEKLIQCDPRLNFLSQQEEMVLESPYFDTRVSVFDDSNETNQGFGEQRHAFFDMQGDASPSGAHSSPAKDEDNDPVGQPMEHFPHDSPSSSSAIEEFRNSKAEELKGLLNQDRFKMSGLHPSMSMSDLVNHIEHRISEQRSSNNFALSAEERQSLEILKEISQFLFSESQLASASDEQSIMKRVDSLCCLLQKDPVLQVRNDKGSDLRVDDRISESNSDLPSEDEDEAPEDPTSEVGCNDVTRSKLAPPAMSRKDSVGELLLNLPRIASLPQFLFNISEDYDNQAR